VGVVVVVVDVEKVRARMPECLGRVALDVAAVQEHDRALVDVPGGLGHKPLQRQEAVLLRQRQVALGDEHEAVLADLGQDALHRHQRADGVAVGVLMGDDDELVGVTQFGEHSVAGGTVAVAGHRSSSRS
jgi:hypothetical protein